MAYPASYILLVNAKAEDRALLRSRLEHIDVKVFSVSSGAEALDVLQKEIVDLVITDIEIGQFDGWRLARIIRSGIYQNGRDIPIIIVTRMWSERITEITARDFGVNKLIAFDSAEELPDCVQSCLDSPDHGRQRTRLLVIEDHYDNADLVRKILKNRFDVSLAYDGESGVNEWKEHRHDLILLDVMLPKMSGSAVLKEIMSIDPMQPVVIMTAHATMEIARHLMMSGATDFISKPFRPEELRRICELAIRRDDYLVSNAQFAERVKNIHKLKHLLDDVINSMPSVLVGVDGQTQVTLWNKGAENLTSMPARDATGQLLEKIWPEFQHLQKVRTALSQGQVQKLTKVPCNSRQKEFFSDITIYPLFENEEVEGAVIRVDDITQRLALEERFLQSEKMISIGRLVSGLSHEINNPLAAMLQNVQVIRNRLFDDSPANQRIAKEMRLNLEDLRKYIGQRKIDTQFEAVIESGSRMAKLIENMLSFSQKDVSGMKMYRFETLMDKALELTSGNFDLKKGFDFKCIQIDREYAGNLTPVRCNAAQIQNVFFTLLQIAADKMFQKKQKKENDQNGTAYFPHLIVRIKDAGHAVIVEVEDNGVGMGRVVQHETLEFFSAEQGENSDYGMGLFLCQYIIADNHGGTISVSSIPGSGTTFQLEIPRN